MAPQMAALAVLFVTHAIGGFAAFGSTLLALPLLLLIGWNIETAVAVLVLGGLAQTLLMALLAGRGADWRALGRILLVAGLGVPVGILTVAWLPERALQAALGLVLLAAGASRLAERLRRRPYAPPRWALVILLFAGGVIHGAFASGGATLTVYGKYTLPTKESFRGTLSIMWVVLNAAVLGGRILSGGIGAEALALSAVGVPTILAATLLGSWGAGRMRQERFVDLVSALLCVAGAVTLLRALT